MPDVHNKATRSYNMSRIRAKDTSPELLVRKFLHARGFRYKLHDRSLPGSPDLVLPKYKTIIFVHGCFWHGHADCKYFVVPKTRTDFWMGKIMTNMSSDALAVRRLRAAGWKVITVWECQLKPKLVRHTLARLMRGIVS
ncbi:MAG TPA: DNA mismatch endonuclease Vsr [Puia sp.]|nr:DNA mismatch endonuclease Vsr [Puia sp.]